MKEIVNLEKLNSYGLKQPANNPNYITPDNITHAQLRYNDFTSSYVIQGSAVGGANSTFEFTITANLNYTLFKLFTSTDGTNYTENKTYGGSLGKSILSSENADITIRQSNGDTYTYTHSDVADAFDTVTSGGTITFKSGTCTIYEELTLKDNVVYNFENGSIIVSEVDYITANKIASLDQNGSSYSPPVTITRRYEGDYALTERESWTLDLNTGGSASISVDYSTKTITLTYVNNTTTFGALETLINADATFRNYFDAIDLGSGITLNGKFTSTSSFTYIYNVTQSNDLFVVTDNNDVITITGEGKFTGNTSGRLFYLSGNSEYNIRFGSLIVNDGGSAVALSSGFLRMTGKLIEVNDLLGSGIITTLNDEANTGYDISVQKIEGQGVLHVCDDISFVTERRTIIRNTFFEILTNVDNELMTCVSSGVGQTARIIYQNCLFKNNINVAGSNCISVLGGNNIIELISCGFDVKNASSYCVETVESIISIGTISNKAVSGTETSGTITVSSDFKIY